MFAEQRVQGTVWTFIATWIFQIPVIASMAEMASMAPTSAGQYHWVSGTLSNCIEALVEVAYVMYRICTAFHTKLPELRFRLAVCTWLAK